MHDEHSDQIVARALQEVSARQNAAPRQRQGIGWGWLFPALVLAVLAFFVALPGPLPQKLRQAMRGVCGLRPDHSFFAGELQLPLEARMTGIFGGFTLTLVLLAAAGRLGRRRLGNRIMIATLLFCFAVMGFDGINSTLAEFSQPHIYTPTNTLRLLTGLLAGIALAPFLAWLVGTMTAPRTQETERPVVASLEELLFPLGVGALFALIVTAEFGWFYYPIALISVIGVVTVVAKVALLIILSSTAQAGPIARPHQLITTGSLAVLVAFGVLAGTALMR